MTKEKSGRYPWGKEGEDEKVTITRNDGSTYEGTVDDFIRELGELVK